MVAPHLLCVGMEVENVQDCTAHVPLVGGACVIRSPDKEVELWVRERFCMERAGWKGVEKQGMGGH